MDDKWVFRGWDAIGHKGWVYGDLVHNQKVTETGLEPRVMVGGYEVVPESVGICLNIKDAKGTMLYEGDIVRIQSDVAKMFEIESEGVIHYTFGAFYFGKTSRRATVDFICSCIGEFRGIVIGNVFQNSELLKEDNHG